MNSRFNPPFIGPSGDFQEDLRRFNHANLEALHSGLITREELIEEALRWAAGNMVDRQYKRYQASLQQAQNHKYILVHESDPKKYVRVTQAELGTFIRKKHLDREELLKVLRGEQKQHKGWYVSPRAFAGSGYAGIVYQEPKQYDPDPALETPQASKKRLFTLASKRKAEQQAAEPPTIVDFNPEGE
jgi:hypothetical protein